jgi:hypothetical protein
MHAPDTVLFIGAACALVWLNSTEFLFVHSLVAVLTAPVERSAKVDHFGIDWSQT